MEKQFVTFEIAKALKAIGFDEVCIAYFEVPTMKFYPMGAICSPDSMHFASFVPELQPDTLIAAPLWQQVFDWLETKNMSVEVDYVHKLNAYHFTIERRFDGLHLVNFLHYPNHPDRYSANVMAITEALKILQDPTVVGILKKTRLEDA